MEVLNSLNEQLVTEAYAQYQQGVYFYLLRHINNEDEAQDLTQDVFLKLMECGSMVCKATLKSFVYTIAHNMMIDFARRRIKHQEVEEYISTTYNEDSMLYSKNADQDAIVNDLLNLEECRMKLLPPQRQKVYCMKRYEGLSVPEIADRLHLSRRTVEGHLAISRNEIQSYIRACIKETV